jgi:cytochrome P450 family 3 subfamily A
MDAIARCAFGMKIDNLGEKDDPFMAMAKAIFNPPVNKTPLAVIHCKFQQLNRKEKVGLTFLNGCGS